MKSPINAMTNEEKFIYVKFPLLMLTTCVACGIMGVLAILIAGQPYFAYVVWGGGVFIFIYGFTDWLSAFKSWRNRETRRSGLKKEGNPKEKE